MLFNSPEFIFVFFPLVLFAFWFISARYSNLQTITFLLVASLFFYSFWRFEYLFVIGGSIVINYVIALVILKFREYKKAIFFIGVSLNLGLLIFYKYLPFQSELPLAISFFTFQQIAYLTIVFKGEKTEKNFIYYACFIAFFPHLIAGPIVLEQDIVPQLRNRNKSPDWNMLSRGLALFSAGLAKKMLIADKISPYANQIFSKAELNVGLTSTDAYLGSLAYTLQLYYDFSGYSDMAIGLGWMFAINLPQNFKSPYKATSIIDFWKRWHMTLSRFLRDHLYIPMGGGRSHKIRNLFLTMVLGGIWHGAGWTFVIWGGFHGILLVVNHIIRRFTWTVKLPSQLVLTLKWFATFYIVNLGWILFRAKTIDGSINMIQAMWIQNPLAEGEHLGSSLSLTMGVALLFACILPSFYEVLSDRNIFGNDVREDGNNFWQRCPNIVWALMSLSFLGFCFRELLNSSVIQEFLYFNF